MEQVLGIGLPIGVMCLGVFFVVLFVDYVTHKVWLHVPRPKVRAVIKWAWTMWLPLWPIAIGGLWGSTGHVLIPEKVAALGPVPGLVSAIYGAFCGMICMAVVKQVKDTFEKKGIDLTIPTLHEAKLTAKRERVETKAARMRPAEGGDEDPPEDEGDGEAQG